ncbi:hypothetical protein [Prosthecobacter sp.]|uniref:hypothetical protein n=1 Tax=Prosthecobacter sp. TaxID=1965333 RepID=UPI0037848FAE
MRFGYHIHGMELLKAMFAGWSYLFSRSCRLKKHREWRENGRLWVILEIIYGLSGILLSLVVLGLVVFAIWTSPSH